MAKGYTHYYYGKGKGKTTAALGLALRASGHGLSVVIVQFLKDWDCGELRSLERLPNIAVFRGKSPGGVFVRDMDEAEKAETKAIHEENLKRALALVDAGLCDVLILDEASDAARLGVLDKEMLAGLVSGKPEALELVITGHFPDAALMSEADYVTEMVKRKHPFDAGVAARRGVEY